MQITDCKVLKTKDGKSRKIAFVGFVSSDMANLAVEYFDRSYAGTSRLSVSLAFSKKKKGEGGDGGGGEGGGEGYRPWSKHSVGSSRYAKLHEQEQLKQEQQQQLESKSQKKGGTNKKSSKDEEERDIDDAESKEQEEVDRKREEFLSAMGLSKKQAGSDKGSQVSGKSKFWANDDAMPSEQPAVTMESNAKDGESSSSESDSDNSSSSDSDSEDDNDQAKDAAKKKNEVSSDLDFLKSKQVKADILSDDDDDDSSASSSDSSSSSSSDSDSSDDEDDAKEEKDSKPTSKINEATGSKNNDNNNATTTTALANRLFVRNLPFTTTEDDLHETFAQFGNVSSVHIPVDDTKRNKGYAFINYTNTADAKLALDTMDGEDYQGRLIHILPARPSMEQSNANADINDPNLTYKERQELIRQKEAEKTSQGWSASFLRGDAVIDNISDRLGVSKGDVLNVKDGISSGNAAVRLALGETHIISENIEFFESHGVDVTALESNKNKKGGRGAASGGSSSSAKRSKTMVLVKNLPYDTTLEDLTKVFHGIGGDVPQRILLPPSKTAALVEYGHATDARRAFRRLAYKKFKHVPLYLEWAPMKEADDKTQNSSKGDEDATKDAQKKSKQDSNNDGIVVKKGLVEEDPSNEAADTGISQTVYIKNLNFSTTEDKLKKAFTKAGFEPRAVKIPTKAAPLKKQKSTTADSSSEMRQVSMGFGFVEFSSEEDALKAMKSLQGKVVDGHALEIKLSTKSLSSSSSKLPAADKASKNTKIMVRNVPFEATRTELLQLFGSFGQLKKVRLPKKFDGTHRGFAFCEFVTSQEAQNAMTTLSRTHLYGRHLVLEWASAADDEGNEKVDVGTIREKAKRDAMRAGLGGVRGGKKAKHLKF